MGADASQMTLRYLEEATWGTTPSSAMTELRFTSESISPNKESTRSSEVVSDRQTSDIITTGWSSGGSVDGELSYGTYDPFIESALQADFAAEDTVTATTISATGTSFDDSGNGLGDFEVGQFVSVSGFSDSTIDGVYRITAVAAGSLTVSPAPTATESASASVTIKGSLLQNGTTEKSFSMEKEFGDLSNVFLSYTGMVADTFSLSFDSGSPIGVSFGLLGKKEVSGTATIGTGAASAATTTEVMDSITDLIRVAEAGTAQTEVRSGTINVANGTRARRVVSNTSPASMGYGNIEVSGSLTAYFSDLTLKDKLLDSTWTTLEIVFEDSAGNAYGIFLPRVQYSAGPTNATGNNADIELQMSFDAVKDPTLGKTIMVTRMAA